MSAKKPNRYDQIIEHIFFSHHKAGSTGVSFTSEEYEEAARALGIPLVRNAPDILYSYRAGRSALPHKVKATAPKGASWEIVLDGRGRYRFELRKPFSIIPNAGLAETKVPDATPGIIEKYAFADEQALLAKVRYNRLIDVFTGVTCYSLQNHLRTALPNGAQVEADEVYIGVNRQGVHFVFPVEAKGATETLRILQIEQGHDLCRARFPDLVCRPIGAQFVEPGLIALFEFEPSDGGLRIASEKHYRLVAPEAVSREDLAAYRERTD